LNSDGTVRAVVGADDVCDVSGWEDVVSIKEDGALVFGLKRDGTVYTTRHWGDEDEYFAASQWSDVARIELGSSTLFGITSAGTVLAAGNNDSGQADVSGWTDIVAVSNGYHHTLGLKADGTVVATGDGAGGCCDVEGWTDVTAVYIYGSNSYGLTLDGRVLIAGGLLSKETVESWTDIVGLYPLNGYPAGLKADGTVVDYWTRSWRNVIAASADEYYVVFGIDAERNLLLRDDIDIIVARGAKSILSTWSDIVAITNDFPYVALKSDGTVISLYDEAPYGYNYDFSDWKLF
jgi:hypothetical protein